MRRCLISALTWCVWQDMIVVHAETPLWNTVEGLCGNLDGNVYNDLLSDGLRETLQYFSSQGESLHLHGISEGLIFHTCSLC